LDLAASIALVVALLALGAAYAVRVALQGAVRFARVDAAGSSVLLGHTAMEMAYWALSPVAKALARLGVRANSITLLSLVLGAGAGVALVGGHFGIGAALSAVSALGDALDGFVARESNTASDAGETFDAAVDRYNEFFFLGGLAIYYRANALFLALVLFTLLGSFMVSYATAKAEALRVDAPRGAMRRQERAVYLTAGVALAPFAAAAPRFAQVSIVADVPVIVALLVVAVVANISAVQRLYRIAQLAAIREQSSDAERARVAAGRPPSEPDPRGLGTVVR
jgi:CDP-diacylglycerol--glycerol-3-phosphate 3-phosphatidyltransferase